MKFWHKAKSKNSIWKRRQDNGGFTLVELIVVLVVLGILATLAFMSLIGWQNHADFKQNNEFAKSIFQAAQIQLTQYGERGQLTELINAVTDGGKSPRSEYLLSEQGELKAEGGSLNVADGSDSGIWENGHIGSIYFLMAEKGDYQTYVNELKGLTAAQSQARTLKERRIKALFDMIDPYISDKAMLDAAICIEFDPDPKVALVYSVFYNYKADSFTYEKAAGGEIAGGTAPIWDRTRAVRRNAGTGYYGADTMAKGTDTYISRPVLSNVRLNNEETLNLSWTTKGDAGKALTRLIYDIDLYGENPDGTSKKLMTVTLGKTDKEQITDTNGTVEASVVRADGSGTADEKCVFPIKINAAENKITLVFDGLDLNADEKAAAEKLGQTASISRLRLDADVIYAVITGKRPGVYDITIKKQSNSEHQYFGGMTVNADNSVTYGIENTRHLNNIRYREAAYAANDGTGAPEFIYQVSRDISWEYAVNSGAVYQDMVQKFPEGGDISSFYFKPILTLRSHSALVSDNGETGRSLIKFRFNAAHTAAAEHSSLGLVAENRGTMRNLSMKGVHVDGAASGSGTGAVYAEAAGSFCGVNYGVLENLSVEESADHVQSEVSGLAYVGGIAGRSGIAAAGDDRQAYIDLKNRANVTGQRYVGGIVGSLETGGGRIAVKGCKNYGKVRGRLAEDGKEAWFFGGITGYAGAGGGIEPSGVAGLVNLTDCQSSPYYTETEIGELIGKLETADSSELVENYVGGIAGYNDVAQIINCNTEQEQAGRRGYVVGKDYVGGIIGYNSSLVSLSGGINNRNQVHVIGHSFVGGIAGCNAVGELTGDADSGFRLKLEDSGTTLRRAEITGWINEGFVTSTGDYAGGITGFNSETGVIEDSYSNVEYDGNAETLSRVSSRARFAGGVAGYNKGRIAGVKGTVTTVSVISGKDYVGGVVGCNDVGGQISAYELEGGYVEGKHFVGGFIGLNMEPGIFKNPLKSNPNKVSGNYFVGGVIGGNLAVADSAVKEMQVMFETDNFLGDLLAEQGAFAGGFIGYNYLLTPQAANEASAEELAGAAASGDVKISHILAATNRLCAEGSLPGLDSLTEKVSDSLEDSIEKLLSGYANKDTHMVITGEGTSASHQTLGSVRGKVYVGGVVGYNQPDTWLEIRNVENITPVEATGYIERVEAGMTDSHHYSYAGGMIGKVGPRVTLNNCRNRDAGEVRGKGTYTGGLAEINYGTVKNCTAGNIGDGTESYVGGIVGVNASVKTGTGETTGNGIGLLADCSVGGQVSGVNYVGGLAAENYGVIRYTGKSGAGETGTEPTVDASGRYVGGIVGYAHNGGEILIDGNITLDINVSGSAQYVGGIAGVNAGIIKVAEGTGNYIIENNKENTIIGRNYVGGFIGVQLEPGSSANGSKNSTVTLRRFENHAEVQASYGYAGGIVALVQKTLNPTGEQKHDVTDRVILERCSNHGRVEVLSGEDNDEVEIQPEEGVIGAGSNGEIIPDTDGDGIASAGGITAVNHGIIRLCGNYGEVAANSGYAGGITALNYHEIDRSETAAKDMVMDKDKTSEPLELSGDLRVGGIAAVNGAADSSADKKKPATINRCAVRGVILRNQTTSESGSMGGIAAWNEGRIEDCFVGVGLDPKELADDDKSSVDDSAYSGLRAEAAGYVEKGMAASTFQTGSSLQGNSVLLVSYAADVNMGGIAGQNENTISGTEHPSNGSGYYSVAAADLRFTGDSMNYFGNIGGIAGVNGGTIEKYEFSGYIRGSAGDPANTPEYSPAYDLEQNKSRIYGYGGIAGRNGSDLTTDNTAKIERCYLGMAKIQGTGDGSNRANVGGVAGFNGAGAVIGNIVFSQVSGADAPGSGKSYFTKTLDAQYAKGNSVKWDPPVEVNASGTVWLNVTNYGHLGGVAGYNRGSISDINWTSRYAANREIEGSSSEGYFPDGKYRGVGKHISEVDGTGVLVTSAAGLVGGITGYNHRTGSVSRAVTGSRWLVSATSQQLGNGIGGIIGYNISENDIVSCDNHAIVFKKADDAVGGITGCQETGTSSSWRYYDCKNYGMLYAKNRGGGIIGVWKYKGGTIESCQNYGEVCSLNTCGGGIVSLVESVAGGETINLTQCENFGEVYSNNYLVRLAGILSYVDDSQAGINVQISECVNTGNLIGNYVAKDPTVGAMIGRGGIFGTVYEADGFKSQTKIDIRYCRNYSFIREDSRYYGITKGTENTTLTYCFGAANGDQKIGDWTIGTWGLQYPISEAGNVKNSYYFAEVDGWGRSIDGGQGNPMQIYSNQAIYYDEWRPSVIIPDMGYYGIDDIVFQHTKERSRRTSDESYRLCKGEGSLGGLDRYLEAVGSGAGTLLPPDLNTPVLAANGEYMVSWKPVKGARYYNVICQYLDAGGNPMLDEQGNKIEPKISKVYADSALVSSTFEANGTYASGVEVWVQACSEKTASAPSLPVQITFGIRPPYPQISWELAEISDAGYRIVLNNREEYETFVKEHILTDMSGSEPNYETKVEEELKKIVIHTTGIEQPFTVWDEGFKTDGQYSLVKPPTAGNTDRKTVTSYAEYTETDTRIMKQSVQVIRESQFPGRYYYQRTGNPTGKLEKFADVQIEKTNESTDIGFAGKTAEELSYHMELKNNGAAESWEVYYRSEMMAVDPELGVPVAVSVAEQTPIPSTAGEKISVKLSNFPKDFLEKDQDGRYLYQDVCVRTYPTFMANNIVRQGWKVTEEEYTADELKALKVSESGNLGQNNLITGPQTVRAGYVIVWAGKNIQGENIYTVYYNTLLKKALENTNSLPMDQKAWYQGYTYMINQIFYHKIDLASAIDNVQPKPVVYVNAAYDTVGTAWKDGDKYDESDKFVLTWDQAAAGGRPAYPGAEPDLNGDDTDYKKAYYHLTLTGTTADGKTTILENTKEIYTVDRTGAGYNTYTADSGNWDYTNISVKLTRVGEVTASGITTKFPAAVERNFPMRRRLSQIKDVKVSLKKNENGVVIKDALHYDISFNGVTDAAEKNTLFVYRIFLKSLDNTAKEKTIDVKPEDIRDDGAGRLTADLDLSGFRSERISITVQAIAKENDSTYRNGLLSPAREMTVPARLLPPQMGKPEGGTENNMTALGYTDNQVMTVDAFEAAALTLEMKKGEYGSETTQVKYQIAMELYDTEVKAIEGKDPLEAPDAGLPERSDTNKTTMTLDTVSGKHSFVVKNLPVTYAGKWVRIVLRSLGSSSISSVWTDEEDPGIEGVDGGIPKVEPCMVFKLPAVQVDPVKFRELEDTEAWETADYTVYLGEEPLKDDISGLPVQASAQQRWVWFDTVDYADDYRITMIQTPQQADKNAASSDWKVTDVNWMTLTRTGEETYELSYRTTEGADAKSPVMETKNITVGNEVEIPYRENIRILDDKSYYIQASAKLELVRETDGKVSVKILLPDCRMDDTAGTGMIYHKRTEQILVQSVVKAPDTGEAGAYRDSRWALVSWSDDDLVQSLDPIDQDKETTALTKAPLDAVEMTAALPYIFRSDLEGATRYLVRVTSGTGEELGVFGVPVDTKNVTIGSFVQSVWFPAGFKDYAQKEVRLQFQSIFDVSSAGKGGLSKAFTGDYRIALPELTTQVNGTKIVSRMAEPVQYRIDVTNDTGFLRSRKPRVSETFVLTAPQKTLVWDYDLSDARIAGYELAIGGRQMEKEFTETLDLRRRLFGAMPGLQEYLEPGGKLLYTVDYHVDGEIALDLSKEHPQATGSNATASNGTATPSDTATASDSDMASGSNWSGEQNVLTLGCRLWAEYVESEDGDVILRFTLMLPELSFDWMQDNVVSLYQEAFTEGLYQTETFRLTPVTANEWFKKDETLLDLVELRGELME